MQFWSLKGQVGYDEVKALQLSLVDLRAQDAIEDTVLFLEHRPVITRGRGLQFTGQPRERHMPIAPALLPPGIEFAESERGGDLTYHGPGQLVIYPIVKLDGQGFAPKHDIAGFLRKLEGVLIDELASQGLRGEMRENATGVWVGERKIASIGIAVRRWVTYHGVAINVVNDLKPFYLFSPCGFAPEVMTRLADLVEVDSASWRRELEQRLAARIAGQDVTVREVTLREAALETALEETPLNRGVFEAKDLPQSQNPTL